MSVIVAILVLFALLLIGDEFASFIGVSGPVGIVILFYIVGVSIGVTGALRNRRRH